MAPPKIFACIFVIGFPTITLIHTIAVTNVVATENGVSAAVQIQLQKSTVQFPLSQIGMSQKHFNARRVLLMMPSQTITNVANVNPVFMTATR